MRVASVFAAMGSATVLWLSSAFADSGTSPVVELDWAAPGLLSDLAVSEPQTDFGAINNGVSSGLGTSAFASSDPSAPMSQLLGPTLVSPLRALSSSKDFVGATIALAGDFHVRLGASVDAAGEPALPVVSDVDQLRLARSAETGDGHTVLAGVDWNFASWGGLGIAASQSEQQTTDLSSPVRLQIGGTRLATMVGVSAHLSFGDGWVTSFSYDESRTQLDLSPNTLTVQDGRGFGVEVSKKGLIDDDALGIAVIRPAQPSNSALALGGYDSRLLGSQISLSSATPETDFELGYETSFNGNITLQANAAYQMNVAGQNGTKGVSVISRAKINF